MRLEQEKTDEQKLNGIKGVYLEELKRLKDTYLSI